MKNNTFKQNFFFFFNIKYFAYLKGIKHHTSGYFKRILREDILSVLTFERHKNIVFKGFEENI